jgi:hypothetical protein
MAEKSRAEYYRGYRKTVKPLNEREARAEGFKAGVQACVDLAKKAGEFQLAVRLQRIGDHENPELKIRRAFLETLNPINGTR